MNSFTFKKDEKLCSQKVIGDLFTSGSSFLCFPLKVIWIKFGSSASNQVQAAFSVPKRNFKRSHDRNFLKRRIREAYRLHKHQLYNLLESKGEKIALMMVYIGKETSDFREIDTAVRKVISRFEREIFREDEKKAQI